MTAEAIVMNRSAIALAADSAVTIRGPRAYKTFDTANKLFELIKGSNVGVMVYNNMLLNRTPWETIIKAYRTEHHSFHAPHVTDYLDHFLDFLGDSEFLLPPDEEDEGVLAVAYDELIPVAAKLRDRYSEFLTEKGNVVKTRANSVLSEICDEWEDQIDKKEDVPTAGDIKFGELSTTFIEPIKDMIRYEIFAAFGLKAPLIRRLALLALRSITKIEDRESDSGLVFAGFGTQQYLPSFASTRLSARVLGQTIHRPPEILEITDIPESGYIRTFAQDEPALGWITGISQQTRDLISYYWENWVGNQLPKQLRRQLPNQTGFNAALRKKVTQEVLGLAQNQLSDFFSFMDEYEFVEFIQPMFESVAALPKDELGLLAESLVNITSLKQRMSVYESNTVGGAIDVAVISIGDGFVWINRKHYFDEKFNPTWHLTHGARINT